MNKQLIKAYDDFKSLWFIQCIEMAIKLEEKRSDEITSDIIRG